MSTPERFDHPVLNDLYVTLETIEEAEKILKRSKDLLHQITTELPTRIGNNDDLKDAIFHHLYWFDERVSATALKQAFQRYPLSQTSKRNAPNAIRNARVEITCNQCTQPFYKEFDSRNKLNIHREGVTRTEKYTRVGYRETCPDCLTKAAFQTNDQYQRWQEEREQYLHHLRTMPYSEYLQTPHWQERRTRSLKKAGFRCQVCNAYGVRLNVHHRTYERRGYEFDTDLIVLCQECHGIFHENGKLAEDGSED